MQVGSEEVDQVQQKLNKILETRYDTDRVRKTFHVIKNHEKIEFLGNHGKFKDFVDLLH